MGIDIVIATYKRPGDVDILLDSLLLQCMDDDVIFIVFQNLSEKKQYSDKRIKTLFSYPANLPKARNMGAKAGNNQFILFLDDDVIACDNLIENHKKCYQNSVLGAVAGYIDDPVFSKDHNDLPSRFDSATGKLVQNFSVTKSQYSISVMGANMSFRRDALNRIGGFDPCFKRNALWEEIDCSFRLLNKNYLIWYNSDAKVIHLRKNVGGCRTDLSYRYIYHSYANTAYFCLKYTPKKFLKSWYRYWKYRLEYDTRITGDKKHNYISVLYGVIGALAGVIRFLFKGRRIGLPEQIDSYGVSL